MTGGENRKGSLAATGYSETAQRTGTKSCLEPISQSIQKTVEDRSRIGVFHCQYHVKNAVRTYLEPIRNRMEKTIEVYLPNLRCLK